MTTMSQSLLSLAAIQELRQLDTPDTLPQRILQYLNNDGNVYRTAVESLLGIPCFSAEQLKDSHIYYDIISFAESVGRQCVLLACASERVLVVSDPFDLVLRNWAQQKLKANYKLAFALPNELHTFLADIEKTYRSIEQVSLGEEGGETWQDIPQITLASLNEDVSPIVKLVNSSLYDALKSKASDIHFECTQTGLEIKYRIDGILLHASSAGGTETAEQAISRLKVLAELDISERRVPQDGRFKAFINNREIDFRVSIIPSIYGEDAVLRVLDKSRGGETAKSLTLDGLGLDAATIHSIRALAREPYGLLLVTGPTGSGKSTTLYATLSEINDGTEKIITIEDPVEYQLAGIMQIPVNDKKGLTFAKGLRSILRHDPDKILVGEIRDGETAGIAVQAALTGHLVLTSVHANNAFSVLDRFLHMGVEVHSFVDALIGVVAQRLIRKICPYCGYDDSPPDELLAESGLAREAVSHWHFRKGKTCKECRHTGYLGRIAIAEVLKVNDSLKQALTQRVSTPELSRIAREGGFINMRGVALRAVEQGYTTLQEVNRVTFVD